MSPTTKKEGFSAEEKFKRALSLTKRVLLRDSAAKTHPALSGLYTNERGDPLKDNEIERFFYFANIEQHWPVGMNRCSCCCGR